MSCPGDDGSLFYSSTPGIPQYELVAVLLGVVKGSTLTANGCSNTHIIAPIPLGFRVFVANCLNTPR